MKKKLYENEEVLQRIFSPAKFQKKIFYLPLDIITQKR